MRVFYFHLNRYICIIVRERETTVAAELAE